MQSKPIPEEAREILDDRPTGHLATIRPDGRLSVNPVALLFDGKHVQVSTCTNRAKYKNLAADPRVAISIPHRNNPNYYLEVRGHVQIEPDRDRDFVDRIAQTYMGKQHYDLDPPGAERVVLTIIAEQVSMRKVPLADDPPAAPDVHASS
ncbi:MAG: PPOX class F420-dependent oxidoreductase [Deltaproteobacteria bacterium]|jgi:PPOX class probable F420-dependent enzyme|nr:PPOX class F420-dependent oxidoreductase [Deltaproteobacteria bacterium]